MVGLAIFNVIYANFCIYHLWQKRQVYHVFLNSFLQNHSKLNRKLRKDSCRQYPNTSGNNARFFPQQMIDIIPLSFTYLNRHCIYRIKCSLLFNITRSYIYKLYTTCDEMHMTEWFVPELMQYVCIPFKFQSYSRFSANFDDHGPWFM